MSRLLDVHDFVAAKLRWHERVIEDPSLTATAKAVAGRLLHDLNVTKGGAWRSQAGIADSLGLTVRTVRRAVAELVKAGHLRVTVSRGRGHANFYEALVGEGGASEPAEKRTDVSGVASEKRTDVSGVAPKKRTEGVQKADTGVRPYLEDSFIPPCPPQVRRQPDPQLPGPAFPDAEIRRAVIEATDEAFVVSYLDPAAWDPKVRTIVCRGQTGHGRLMERARKKLSELGVVVVIDPKRHAMLPRPIFAHGDAA